MKKLFCTISIVLLLSCSLEKIGVNTLQDGDVTLELVSVNATSATFRITLSDEVSLIKEDYVYSRPMISIGVICNTHPEKLLDYNPTGEMGMITVYEPGTYTISVNLSPDEYYYYAPYYSNARGMHVFLNNKYDLEILKTYELYFDDNVDLDIASAKDLSASATGNSYIVSEPGVYKIRAVKGNTFESLGTNLRCSILYESEGQYSLIKGVDCNDSYLAFKTPEGFLEGNAWISMENKSNEIIWTWHIWFTDKPHEHIYADNSATLMDRNLGATSALKTDGTNRDRYGLTYEWGAKHPTILLNEVSGLGHLENKNWSETKSLYDPCPAGWKVPASDVFEPLHNKVIKPDRLYGGFDFYSILSNSGQIWYEYGTYLFSSNPKLHIPSCIILSESDNKCTWAYTTQGYVRCQKE